MSKKIIYSFVLTILFLDTSAYSMRFITRWSARDVTDEVNRGGDEGIPVVPVTEGNDFELLKAYDVQNLDEPVVLENKIFMVRL